MTEKNRNTPAKTSGGDSPPRRRAKPAPAPAAREKSFEGERIAKIMARAGVCSRRDAEDWIAQGRVAVNGRVLTSPAFNVREGDKIEIDGAPMQERERTRLFLFHKPPGYVTTAHDPEGRATVFAYLTERHADLPRVVSVGRLDINTEGLLLLTNDGGLARTLELPATGWTRRYRVRVHGAIDQARLDALKAGVTIDDIRYAPIDARLERVQGANAWIAMSLTEGKNREIKRVMEHLGLDVTRLIRVSYGPFQLGDLAEGAVEEVRLKTLREQLGKSLAALAGVDFSSPLREPSATEKQELRERAEKRPRKHVSVLRSERDEKNAAGPRARVERSATADRKGRAVAVERVTPTGSGARDATTTRNGRRFEAMRGDARPPRRRETRGAESASDSAPARATRPPRDEHGSRGRQDRPPRGTRDARRDDRQRDAAETRERRESRVQPSASGRRSGRGEAGFEKHRASRGADTRRDGRTERYDSRRADGEKRGDNRAARGRDFDRTRPGGAARPPRKGPPRKGPPKGPRKGPAGPRGRR